MLSEIDCWEPLWRLARALARRKQKLTCKAMGRTPKRAPPPPRARRIARRRCYAPAHHRILRRSSPASSPSLTRSAKKTEKSKRFTSKAPEDAPEMTTSPELARTGKILSASSPEPPHLSPKRSRRKKTLPTEKNSMGRNLNLATRTY